MAERTNAEWVEALSSEGAVQQEALSDLRAFLERSALFYTRRRMSQAERVGADEIQALAEDSAQEASILVLQKLESFRGEAKFLTWAGSFAIRRVMTALRRSLWRNFSLDTLPDGWQEPPSSAIAGMGWSNPELATQRLAIWSVIKEVVQEDLTRRQREVLSQIVINGVPTEIVEDNLGMSPSALYKMTHDARRKVRAGLLKRGYSVEEILGAFAVEG